MTVAGKRLHWKPLQMNQDGTACGRRGMFSGDLARVNCKSCLAKARACFTGRMP